MFRLKTIHPLLAPFLTSVGIHSALWGMFGMELGPDRIPEEITISVVNAKISGRIPLAETSPVNTGKTPGTGYKPASLFAPAYPEPSRLRGEEGTVVLSVYVGLDGVPTQVDVLHSSGFPDLDVAALKAVQMWQLSPTGNRPVEQRIHFRLTEVPAGN